MGSDPVTWILEKIRKKDKDLIQALTKQNQKLRKHAKELERELEESEEEFEELQKDRKVILDGNRYLTKQWEAQQRASRTKIFEEKGEKP